MMTYPRDYLKHRRPSHEPNRGYGGPASVRVLVQKSRDLGGMACVPRRAVWQAAAYRQHTARTTLPTSPATEAWLVCGRRAGKSFILCAVFLAAFYDYRQFLAPGEVGTILIIATDRRQARNIFRFIRGLLTDVPMLRRMIRRETSEAFELENDVVIEVGTASFRSVRGYTIVAALCDEIARWPTDDAAEPDYEILNALRPGI